jgi:hypothetical protein
VVVAAIEQHQNHLSSRALDLGIVVVISKETVTVGVVVIALVTGCIAV